MDKMTTERIKKMLCKEIEQIGEKPDLSPGDLDALYKMTDVVKNLDKIAMLEEYEEGQSDEGYGQYGGDYGQGGGYGRTGYGQRGGRYSRDDEMNYERGNSYARRGQHYVRGHYSRADAQDQVKIQLREMLNDGNLPQRYRDAARKAMEEME